MEGRLPDPGDALTGVELFAGLEPEVRQRVIAAAVPRTYRKGQLLFVENDPGESLIVLRRGAVAVFVTAPTGERAVLSVVRPPGTLGEVSLLDASTRSTSAEAIEDCTALALSRSAFMELVHSNPRILDAVMRSLGALIRRLTEQNADHVFLDLPGRVAKTLVRLAGESQAPMITIELNQSQLAEMAGGSRQSVNQAIGSFANRGWLRTEGRRIVVTDVAALRRRAGMPDR
ncbi:MULTISPECIES: Crp/Fnr family transcriptional regulator [Asanoa]|uniref:CRP-like cAMP-activated global transcriptional regulator n=2 Tax=Asanoa TaxID=195964 RepID=A0ABQ4BX66_9ACTN|nr:MULTISPECIES: Crp/Fnr family transcriptional regulator [Asanoa]MDG4827143.1 Crp/Fnr family transcriptional regulator [Asanoa sp. WMMD1127]GIF55124.1 CRP-like cAMP-activated global transcriptional regulator [Asanoa iriomotensis]GIF71845.1 CRP-like cAMP-activated global transcriptional regulator [Asanoa siamensis]